MCLNETTNVNKRAPPILCLCTMHDMYVCRAAIVRMFPNLSSNHLRVTSFPLEIRSDFLFKRSAAPPPRPVLHLLLSCGTWWVGGREGGSGGGRQSSN